VPFRLFPSPSAFPRCPENLLHQPIDGGLSAFPWPVPASGAVPLLCAFDGVLHAFPRNPASTEQSAMFVIPARALGQPSVAFLRGANAVAFLKMERSQYSNLGLLNARKRVAGSFCAHSAKDANCLSFQSSLSTTSYASCGGSGALDALEEAQRKRNER